MNLDHKRPHAAPVKENLICDAVKIFDDRAVTESIRIEVEETGLKGADLRRAVSKILLAAHKSGHKAIQRSFEDNPFASRRTARSFAWLTDCIVKTVFDVATKHLNPNPTPTEGERISLLSVGGYGRGEMAPKSDVDLLFLTPYKITPWAESLIEDMLYMLWDLRLKVGHASRTVKDCLRLGAEDFTIRTALLEQRFIVGDQGLADELRDRLWSELFHGTESEFIEAKLDERDLRHKKQGGQRYMVEPNVKEGKGGLRDLHALFWIAKYVYRVRDTDDLAEAKVFSPDEFDTFVQAERFLWAVRCHLHFLTNRGTDLLSFDMQVEVASRMGYKDKTGRRGVEHFMQDYFRHATSVGDLTRIFLTMLEADQQKKEPLSVRLFRRRKKIKQGYKLVHNRLAISDDQEFLANKMNLLRLFEEALRTGLLIHPDAMRLVTANLHLIDDAMRTDKEAIRIFLDLLLKHGNPERALRRMNELNVLSAFIPEFEPIVAMMQFNMYHSYTVDEHTIQCISSLAEIERSEREDELPLSSSILKRGINRKVLYVALLLHDIGKGREIDHSILGAQISRKVAPRLGLKPAECETVEWLVRYHLLMSDVAQKRDLSDPRTIRAFAKAVKTKERLDLLTVLTVCDIRGVGPDTWNNWKAVLLRNLYNETFDALDMGLEAVNRENRGAVAKKALREELRNWTGPELKRETSRHYPPYWQGLQTETQVIFAQLLRGLQENDIAIDLHLDEGRDATRAMFVLQDHPGIFSRLSGALAQVGGNVVDARTYTSKDGYATAVFWLQDDDGNPYEASRLGRLQEMIMKFLKGEVVATEAIETRDKIKKRERAFKVPTTITFDNEGSDIYTIIEVDTRDHPGLLYDLTRTLANANIYIASAVIATYGEQVVDSFYVKDMFGLKFHSESKQKTLEKRLREAITKGALRAVS